MQQFSKEDNENESFLKIGDFGVLSIMKDALLKTRVVPGAFNYQAPEVIGTQTFDFGADIYSIGAILLDICTTSLYDVIDYLEI